MDNPHGEPGDPDRDRPAGYVDDPEGQPSLEIEGDSSAASTARASLIRVVALALVIVAVGAVLGWAWAELAPRVPVLKVDGGYAYAEAEPEQAVAADGWFALLGAVAGVVFAVVAWFGFRRFRGPLMVVGLVLGSLIASVLSWWVGHRLGTHEFHRVADSAPLGTRLDGPLSLRMAGMDAKAWWHSRPTGVVAVQALLAALVYTSLAGLSADPRLRPGNGGPSGTTDGATGTTDGATGGLTGGPTGAADN